MFQIGEFSKLTQITIRMLRYYDEGDLWQELSAFAAEHQIQISKNTFSIYYDTEYREKDVDVEGSFKFLLSTLTIIPR